LEIKTYHADDVKHVERLKTTLEWNLKDKLSLLYS